MGTKIKLVDYRTRKETVTSPKNLKALGEAERRVRAVERKGNEGNGK